VHEHGAFAIMGYLAVYGQKLGNNPLADAGEDLADAAGLAARHPALAAGMLFFLFSLTGIPPTAGFMGKLMLFKEAFFSLYHDGAYGCGQQHHLGLVLSWRGKAHVHAGSPGKSHRTRADSFGWCGREGCPSVLSGRCGAVGRVSADAVFVGTCVFLRNPLLRGVFRHYNPLRVRDVDREELE